MRTEEIKVVDFSDPNNDTYNTPTLESIEGPSCAVQNAVSLLSAASPQAARSLFSESSANGEEAKKQPGQRNEREEASEIVKDLLKKRREGQKKRDYSEERSATKHEKYRDNMTPSGYRLQTPISLNKKPCNFRSASACKPRRTCNTIMGSEAESSVVDKVMNRLLANTRTQSACDCYVTGSRKSNLKPCPEATAFRPSVYANQQKHEHTTFDSRTMTPKPAISKNSQTISKKYTHDYGTSFVNRMRVKENVRKQTAMAKMLKAHIAVMSQVTGKPYISRASRELAAQSAHRMGKQK